MSIHGTRGEQFRLFAGATGAKGLVDLSGGHPPTATQAFVPQMSGVANVSHDFAGFSSNLSSHFGEARTQQSPIVPLPSSQILSHLELWKAVGSTYGPSASGKATFLAFQAVAYQRAALMVFTQAAQAGTGQVVGPGVLDDVTYKWLQKEVPTWTWRTPDDDSSKKRYSLCDVFSNGGDANSFCALMGGGESNWDFMLGEGCYGCSKGPLSSASTIGLPADTVDFFGHPLGYYKDMVKYWRRARAGNNSEDDGPPPLVEAEASSSQGHEGPPGLTPPSLCLRRVLPLPWCLLHPAFTDADNNLLLMLVSVGIRTLEEEGLPTIEQVCACEDECLELTSNILKARKDEGKLVGALFSWRERIWADCWVPYSHPPASGPQSESPAACTHGPRLVLTDIPAAAASGWLRLDRACGHLCCPNPPRLALTNHGMHSLTSLPQPGCVMIELVATWGGFFIRPSYARKLAELLTSYGVSLIVDECFTAWRCGCPLLSRSDAYALHPEFITLGKWGLGLLLVREDAPCTVTPEPCCNFNINGRPAPPRQASALPGAVFEQIFRDVWSMRSTGLLNTTGEPQASLKLLECVVAQGTAWGNKIQADLGIQRLPGEDRVRMWGAGLILFVNVYPHVCGNLAAAGLTAAHLDPQVAGDLEAMTSGACRAASGGRPLDEGHLKKRLRAAPLPVCIPGFRSVHQWAQGHDSLHLSFMAVSFRITPVIVNAAFWQLILAESWGNTEIGNTVPHTTLPAILMPNAPVVFEALVRWDKVCETRDDVLPPLALATAAPTAGRGVRRKAAAPVIVVERTPLCTLAGVWGGLLMTHAKLVSFHRGEQHWTEPPSSDVQWQGPRSKAVVSKAALEATKASTV